ncbi:anti-sigma factor [Crassaminicella profunda]|uniref:anti-sigma factor n=1 Tax=Crassaminicella profunda TaxID=1286698 RepID=UPI001CA62916|nr:anti-sigma factor [Crassaminicella profunda]QZY53813.1 anti-sigma factor [Crassaminicella profunda]
MNDDFKKKLKDYTEGKLSKQEKKQIEEDLEKLEQYQEFLDGEVEQDTNQRNKEIFYGHKNEKKILRIGKWKARIQNACTGIGMLIVLVIVFSFITSLFYYSGEPTRLEIYEDVIESTLGITQPNVSTTSTSMGPNPFLTATIAKKLVKRVGKEDIIIGDADYDFFLGRLNNRNLKYIFDNSHRIIFDYPNGSVDQWMHREWKKLEKLPEGTVAEVYLSLDKFYETDEILKKFIDKDVDLLWFAVDTGNEEKMITNPIGFPEAPIWHDDDFILESRQEEGGFFTKTVTESRSAPTVEKYGSGKVRNENFMKTLKFIKKYDSIASEVAPFKTRNIQEKIDYIQKNGVKIYGMVITGPTKELLNLKEEEWIKGMEVGEVRLWNW